MTMMLLLLRQPQLGSFSRSLAPPALLLLGFWWWWWLAWATTV